MHTKVNMLASNWQTRLFRHAPGTLRQRIRTCSDCSGYGSDLIAYTLLNIQKRVLPTEWSEIDPQKVTLHKAVARACGFQSDAVPHPDMFLRNLKAATTAPHSLDVYIAGYPCPSWSSLGRHGGVSDERGLLTLKGLEFIAFRRPRIVILEQVSAILQKKYAMGFPFENLGKTGLRCEVCEAQHKGLRDSTEPHPGVFGSSGSGKLQVSFGNADEKKRPSRSSLLFGKRSGRR